MIRLSDILPDAAAGLYDEQLLQSSIMPTISTKTTAAQPAKNRFLLCYFSAAPDLPSAVFFFADRLFSVVIRGDIAHLFCSPFFLVFCSVPQPAADLPDGFVFIVLANAFSGKGGNIVSVGSGVDKQPKNTL